MCKMLLICLALDDGITKYLSLDEDLNQLMSKFLQNRNF